MLGFSDSANNIISTVDLDFEFIQDRENGCELNERNWRQQCLSCWTCEAMVVGIFEAISGFYFVSYCLGICLVQLLIGFLSPLVDPALEPSDGPMLPIKGSDEFKPLIHRVPELKFWYSFMKALCIAFVMTFFFVFDVYVVWPLLFCYWIGLLVFLMRRQIAHMVKYKYIPFNLGKQTYGGKRSSASSSGTRAN